MADNLFPLGYNDLVASAEEATDPSAIGYRPGIRFDFRTGDFVRDGRRQMQDADGVESWEGWCQACLLTERYQHLAYSTDFGIETRAAFAAETRDKAEALLERQITEALQADPYGRTAYVEDILFVWDTPDSVQVTVTVRGIDNVTIYVTADLTADLTPA